jgi:hypothetical protein
MVGVVGRGGRRGGSAAKGHQCWAQRLVGSAFLGFWKDAWARWEGIQGGGVAGQSRAQRGVLLRYFSLPPPQHFRSFLAMSGNEYLLRFLQAADDGDLDLVRKMLPRIENVGVRVKAMMYAASKRHLEIVEFLLAEGVPTEHDSCKGSWYPIHAAVDSDDLRIVSLLIERWGEAECARQGRFNATAALPVFARPPPPSGKRRQGQRALLE